MSNSRNIPRSVNSIPTLTYWRMSSDDQEASIPQQEQWGNDVCARDNLELLYSDSDPGISGSEIEFRPGLQRIVAKARELFRQGRPARRLLVWKANRLSRADSCDTHAHVIQPLREAGITHVQTQDGKLIDLHDRNDLLLFNIEQDAQSAAYLASLASDVMRGKADIARQGYWNGGPIPLGYRAIRTGDERFRRRLSRLVVGPAEEEELVKWMFQTYLETKTSCAQLARDLNRRGVKPKRASTWSANCIAVILANRTYLGEVRWNDTHVGKFCRLTAGVIHSGTRQQRDETRRRKNLKRLPSERNAKEDAIIVEDAHPPIITQDLFKAVQQKMSQQAGRTSVREDRFYELADLMHCGHCDAKCWCIPNPRAGRPTITRVICSRHRKDGWDACPKSGTEHHGEVLRRVLAILQRDLGGDQAQAKIRAALTRRAKEASERTESRRDAIRKEVRTLEAKKSTEARRLLELPAAVLASASEAHEVTLKALEQARAILDAIETETTVSPATVELGERALGMIGLLPEISKEIGRLQQECEFGRQSSNALELRTVRRKMRDVLFALVSCVRIFWVPVDASERQGKGKGFRKHALDDVQVTLHPHIQDALLNVSANGTTNKHGSSNAGISGPIILSSKYPLVA